MVPPREGNEARGDGRRGIGAPHTTGEAGESCPRHPVEGRGRREMDPLAGKTANTPRLEPVSTSRQRIAERARHAPGMAWVIFIASWTNGYATARSEAICRGAGCGRTRTSGSVGGQGQQRPWSTRPFIGRKRSTVWLFATIEVCSRLWAGSVLGRRSYRNTKAVISDVILRGRLVGVPLIATDGFEYYFGVIARFFGFRVRLWSGAQDSAARSCRPGRAPREDRYNDSVEGSAVGVGGVRDPEHLVRRASQPHDSSRVGVLAPAFAMPRAWRRPAPRTRRAPAVLLQFHSAAPRVAGRARDPDASDAGRCGEQAIGLERRLHGVRPPSACCCGARAHCRDRPAYGI